MVGVERLPLQDRVDLPLRCASEVECEAPNGLDRCLRRMKNLFGYFNSSTEVIHLFIAMSVQGQTSDLGPRNPNVRFALVSRHRWL